MTFYSFNIIANQLTDEEFERKKFYVGVHHWCTSKPYLLVLFYRIKF